ncbi:hypothetical protein ADUPG1_001064, partial [Aduncisulcus paluster]
MEIQLRWLVSGLAV